MGGNRKYRALRMDQGNFSWGGEAIARKTRIIDVVYNPSNNEFGRKKGVKVSEEDQAVLDKVRSKKVQAKYNKRKKTAKVEQALEDQFATGRIYACVASRPGQCGFVDGYVLEGKELEFYVKRMKHKKK